MTKAPYVRAYIEALAIPLDQSDGAFYLTVMTPRFKRLQ